MKAFRVTYIAVDDTASVRVPFFLYLSYTYVFLMRGNMSHFLVLLASVVLENEAEKCDRNDGGLTA